MKSDFLSSQGISVSTAREATNSGSLSHTDCWGKAPLEVLVGRWPTSLIESWESALFLRRYGMHGVFLEFLCWNWCSYRLERGVSGNLWSCPKEDKPTVLHDGEWGIALKPMQGNWLSFQVYLGYTELFHISVVTSVTFYTCEGFLTDSLQFCQANQGSLPVWFLRRHCSAHNTGEWGLISQRGGSFMFFFQITAGTWCIISSYGRGRH